ncbi:hypothetical protein HMPREF9946_01372 [Acetobacteraceae bacterium AT-5844]|nr:hypothetical protein HMPREF9946_01372 [Acetobacteraceae bacterium AT-5844]
MRLNDAMNRVVYGAGFDASRVLAERGGTFAPAMALRGELAQAVRHSAGR